LSWLIVVGGVIALALAVHVAEQRKSRAILLARRTQREAAEPHRFSLSREVKETWAVDLQTMRLELSRSDEAGVSTFSLERSGDGTWRMHPTSSMADGVVTVPALLAEQLEQRYQRVSRSTSKASG
jgi:hypothetical protein